MYSYELEEVFQARRLQSPRLLSVSLSTESILVRIEIKNIGQDPARDVFFHVSPNLARWLEDKPRSLLKSGAKFFSPGEKHVFHGDIIPDIISGKSQFPKTFSIEASYFSPTSQERILESFEFDIGIFEGAGAIQSDTEKMVKQLQELTKTLRTELASIRRSIEATTDRSISGRLIQFVNKNAKWRRNK